MAEGRYIVCGTNVKIFEGDSTRKSTKCTSVTSFCTAFPTKLGVTKQNFLVCVLGVGKVVKKLVTDVHMVYLDVQSPISGILNAHNLWTF